MEQVTNRKALVVDDNKINQLVARVMLEKLGWDVDLACHGSEGLRKASEQAYAVILMDFQMPEMDGAEATRLIRASGGPSRKAVIIGISASGERTICIEAGMNDFLLKPMFLSDLVGIIDRNLVGAEDKGDSTCC